MRRFINFYDENQVELCGESYYFDQRLSNETIISNEQRRHYQQRLAYERNPDKYCKPRASYAQVFRGERFNEDKALTEMIKL